MFITKMTAENFKRLEFVEIELDATGGVTTISGANKAGKTSVIDAFAAVIAGRNGPKLGNPIRLGNDEAQVIAETSDGLIITKRYRRKEDGKIDAELEITNAAGLTKKSPQALLDSFLKGYALDPQKFMNLDPAKQLDTLLEVIEDLPFIPAALDENEDDLFRTRTGVNREVDTLKKQIAGMPKFDASVPPEGISATGVLAKLDELQQRGTHRADIERAIAEDESEIERCDDEIARLNALILSTKDRKSATLDDIAANRGRLDLQPAVDEGEVEALRAQIADADRINSVVAQNAKRTEAEVELAKRAARAAELTAEIEAVKQQRADGLAAATLPYPGLGFADGIVTLNGVPFIDASAGEGLVASIGIAAAANPDMQLVLVRDASLLDGESRAIVEKYATEKDLRIILEVVDPNADTGIVLADGAVQ